MSVFNQNIEEASHNAAVLRGSDFWADVVFHCFEGSSFFPDNMFRVEGDTLITTACDEFNFDCNLQHIDLRNIKNILPFINALDFPGFKTRIYAYPKLSGKSLGINRIHTHHMEITAANIKSITLSSRKIVLNQIRSLQDVDINATHFNLPNIQSWPDITNCNLNVKYISVTSEKLDLCGIKPFQNDIEFWNKLLQPVINLDLKSKVQLAIPKGFKVSDLGLRTGDKFECIYFTTQHHILQLVKADSDFAEFIRKLSQYQDPNYPTEFQTEDGWISSFY